MRVQKIVIQTYFIQDIGPSLYPPIDIEEIEVATEAIETNEPLTNLEDKIQTPECGKKPRKKSTKSRILSSFKKKIKGDSKKKSSRDTSDPESDIEKKPVGKKTSFWGKMFHGSNGKKHFKI